MNNITPNRTGLTLGIAFAIYHSIWLAAMLLGLSRTWLALVQQLHFITFNYQQVSFSLPGALMGIIGALVSGYVVGWIFGAIWQKTKSVK